MCECSGTSDNCSICSVDLYDKIVKSQCSCLNEQRSNSFLSILKPNRLIFVANKSTDMICTSDCDGEIIARIVFDGSVKLIKIFIQTLDPISEVKVFLNNMVVDFNSLTTVIPAQHWSGLEGAGSIIELETRTVKFLNVACCSMWIKSDKVENLRLGHVGFGGEYLHSRNAPIISSYEIAPQPKKLDASELLSKGSFHQF